MESEETSKKTSKGCVFCQIVNGEGDGNEVVAYQDEHTAVFPSLHQRANNRGHMLVVPVPHVSSIYELERKLGGELMHTVSRVALAVKKVFAADGIAIKQHNEKHGGQEIFHVHFHVIPCFKDDGFFRGNQRFPNGMKEVLLETRIKQAKLIRDSLENR